MSTLPLAADVVASGTLCGFTPRRYRLMTGERVFKRYSNGAFKQHGLRCASFNVTRTLGAGIVGTGTMDAGLSGVLDAPGVAICAVGVSDDMVATTGQGAEARTGTTASECVAS